MYFGIAGVSGTGRTDVSSFQRSSPTGKSDFRPACRPRQPFCLLIMVIRGRPVTRDPGSGKQRRTIKPRYSFSRILSSFALLILNGWRYGVSPTDRRDFILLGDGWGFSRRCRVVWELKKLSLSKLSLREIYWHGEVDYAAYLSRLILVCLLIWGV